MRAMKIVATVMAVLIVIMTTVVIVTVVRRLSGAASVAVETATPSAVFAEPAGTEIVSIAAAGDRLAVHLRGGGPDRVIFVDPKSGGVTGRIAVGK